MEDKPKYPLCPFRTSVLILAIVFLVCGSYLIVMESYKIAIGLAFLIIARYAGLWLHLSFMKMKMMAQAEEISKRMHEALSQMAPSAKEDQKKE